MRITRFRSLLFFISIAILWSCQKEVSFQDDINTPGGGGNGGGGSTGAGAGWSFTAAGNTNYYGCIDTAYYETVSGLKALFIDVIDSADNTFTIGLVSQGNITAATYTPAQGATMLFTSHTGNSYISASPSSLSIKVTSINDTLITAEFSATLTDPLGSGSFIITNGKLKALIGKHNGCSIGDPDPVDPGGSNGNADYYLEEGAGQCSNAEINGNYIKDSVLTPDHKVTLDVYVDVEGKWNAGTTTVNGISFSGSGEFTSTGPNTITLQATGKPIATGSFEIPVTAGGSNCNLNVDVDTIAFAPCNPDNNSFVFDVAGIADGNFSYVNSSIYSGNYQISGSGNSGDIRIWFPGTTQPAPGVYNLQQIGPSLSQDEAAISITSTSIYWSPHDGKLYVSVVNGKVVATFCDVTFSGSLGGPGYTSKVSGKITEK